MKKFLSLGISLALLIIIGCGGNPKVPGETEQNPFKFSARDYMSKDMKIEKKYLAVDGIPLTALYAYTYKKKKAATEANAQNFYFPIIPPDYDIQKDVLTIFAYCAPSTFKKITDNLKKFLTIKDKPTLTKGKKSDFVYAVPSHIVKAYEKNNFKVAPSKKRLTIKMTSID